MCIWSFSLLPKENRETLRTSKLGVLWDVLHPKLPLPRRGPFSLSLSFFFSPSPSSSLSLDLLIFWTFSSSLDLDSHSSRSFTSILISLSLSLSLAGHACALSSPCPQPLGHQWHQLKHRGNGWVEWMYVCVIVSVRLFWQEEECMTWLTCYRRCLITIASLRIREANLNSCWTPTQINSGTHTHTHTHTYTLIYLISLILCSILFLSLSQRKEESNCQPARSLDLWWNRVWGVCECFDEFSISSPHNIFLFSFFKSLSFLLPDQGHLPTHHPVQSKRRWFEITQLSQEIPSLFFSSLTLSLFQRDGSVLQFELLLPLEGRASLLPFHWT